MPRLKTGFTPPSKVAVIYSRHGRSWGPVDVITINPKIGQLTDVEMDSVGDDECIVYYELPTRRKAVKHV